MTATMARAPVSEDRYMTRELPPARRRTWRQRVRILDRASGREHTFYVDFGEYDDGRLCEVFITAQKEGTFVRGVLDTLARMTSLALQSGTHPRDVAKLLSDHNYPPHGRVEVDGSTVVGCTSIADYIGQEIEAQYGDDGRRMEWHGTNPSLNAGS